MLNELHPFAQVDYSSRLENFNAELFSSFRGITENLKPKETLLYAYYEMLLEAQSLSHLGETVSSLTKQRSYLEAFMVARGLLERALNFKAASNFETQIVFQRAASLRDGCKIVNSNPSYRFHNCSTTTSEAEEVCLKLTIHRDSPNRFPMARFYISKGSGLLAHDFPNDYRQVLWSYIDESELTASNQWTRKHYTSFDSVVKNLTAIGALKRVDKAKLLSHYGFLSAISHAPFAIVGELHGHNRPNGTFYGPSNRLLHLYVAASLLLVLESLLPWMLEYDYFHHEKIDSLKKLLCEKELIDSELAFPFGPDHLFDEWQRSLPRLASTNETENQLDLSKEFLDPDFLSRILNINTTTTELSIGKTWYPINLYGINTQTP